MRKKLISSYEDFEREYRDVKDQITDIDVYEDIDFPTFEMMEKVKDNLACEVVTEEQNIFKYKRSKTIKILVASILLFVIVGEFAVLKSSFMDSFNITKGTSQKKLEDKSDEKVEVFKGNDLSVYEKAVEEFSKKQGYNIVKSSAINMNIRLPKTFDEFINNVNIGDTLELEKINGLSKQFGYDFKKYLGKKLALYAVNIEKNNTNKGLLITLIYNNNIVGAWISEKDDLQNIIKTCKENDDKNISTQQALDNAKDFIKRYFNSDETMKNIITKDKETNYVKPTYELKFEHSTVKVDAQSGKVIGYDTVNSAKSNKSLSEQSLRNKASDYYKHLGFPTEFENNASVINTDGSICADFSQSIHVNDKTIYNPYNSVRIILNSDGTLRGIVSFYKPLIFTDKSNNILISEDKVKTYYAGVGHDKGVSNFQIPKLEIVVPNNGDLIYSESYMKENPTAVYSEEDYCRLAWVAKGSDDKRSMMLYIDAESGEVIGAAAYK
ncbi:DUF4830 domain-containing protein [Clostridium sp. YIM B02505]|uniref:DUF4830 domain-containing protein n=1 Tax=Clostridium yunnanense TaxID=2800325 RepID=A0ABS1EJT4_9CLOT|nr:DUF4830 domain-containing protein [Clostridium yunnanense]MBK1809622.1 DUF4830 domain-containing protein [Clostridium yunnanense]